MNDKQIIKQVRNALFDAMDVRRNFSFVDTKLVANGVYGLMSQCSYAAQQARRNAY